MHKKDMDLPVISLPRVIFGTSGLGNLYVATDQATKCEIVQLFGYKGYEVRTGKPSYKHSSIVNHEEVYPGA